jgi:hypothetical protein
MTPMKHTMKTLLIAIISILPFVSKAQTASIQQSDVPQAMAQVPAIPRGTWYMIRGDFLPNTPFGWQVINMVPILQNGTTVAGAQIFMHNPTTGQNAVWGVGL